MLFVNKVSGVALLGLGLSALLSSAADLVASPSARQVLWYDNPAQSWESQALPIGNVGWAR
jgi:hypothetical protein